MGAAPVAFLNFRAEIRAPKLDITIPISFHYLDAVPWDDTTSYIYDHTGALLNLDPFFEKLSEPHAVQHFDFYLFCQRFTRTRVRQFSLRTTSTDCLAARIRLNREV